MAPARSADITIASLRGSNSSKFTIQKYLTNCRSLYSCIYCRTHLANHDELVSRSFQGNHGRAYLFNSVVNVSCGQSEQRNLNTGSHAVADIFCSNCHTTLGWKYEKAYVETQKYKEGKYIIELAHVVRESRHLEFDKSEMFLGRDSLKSASTSSGQSSLTPSSPNYWSSSTGSNGEVDDELMFPFYDDLCANRSSYPSSLSSSFHNRMRRSLYLDSTPYDWKYSTTTSSSKGFDGLQATLASSIDSSSNSLPSTSSSSETSSEQRQKSYLGISGRNEDGEVTRDSKVYEHYNQGSGSKIYDDNETQFEFETDKPDIFVVTVSSSNNGIEQGGESCDQIDSDIVSLNSPEDRKNSDRGDLSGISHDDDNTNEGIQQVKPQASGDGSGSSSEDQISDSMSLDDEEFYDCYTEHDVQNLMVASDSTSTLKIS